MQGGVWAPERRALTIGLVATVTLVAFEALAVGTVMPLVARDLGGIELYGWAFSGFFLGNLVGIVAAGGQIDRGGLRRPFVVGLVLFGIGLLVGGLATSMPMLVVGRVVQGAGAGVVPAIAYVTIRRAYPETVRPRMFAILSTAWVVPGLVGPAVAGWIGDHLSWRVVFLGLVPLIVAAALPTVRALGQVPAHSTEAAGDVPRPAAGSRLLGERARLGRAVLVSVGAGLMLAGSTASSAVIGVVLAVAGVVIGVPALAGLLPRGTLRAAHGLPAAILSRGFLTFAFFGMQAYLPLALIEVRGTSATEAGAGPDRGYPFVDGRIVGAGAPADRLGPATHGHDRFRADSRERRRDHGSASAVRADRGRGDFLGSRRPWHGHGLREPVAAGAGGGGPTRGWLRHVRAAAHRRARHVHRHRRRRGDGGDRDRRRRFGGDRHRAGVCAAHRRGCRRRGTEPAARRRTGRPIRGRHHPGAGLDETGARAKPRQGPTT